MLPTGSGNSLLSTCISYPDMHKATVIVFWFSGLSEEKIGVGGWFLFLFFILHVISYHGNTMNLFKSEDPYNNTMTKVSEIL